MSERDGPGTPLYILERMAEWTTELGHSPLSAKHPLTFLREHVASLKARLATATEEREEARALHAAADDRLSEATNQLLTLRHELDQRTEERDAYDTELTARAYQVTELANQCLSLGHRVKQRDAELEFAHKDRDEARDSANRWYGKVKALREALVALHRALYDAYFACFPKDQARELADAVYAAALAATPMDRTATGPVLAEARGGLIQCAGQPGHGCGRWRAPDRPHA